MTSAGPSIEAPIGSVSRRKTFASRHAPLEKKRVVRAGAKDLSATGLRARSEKRAAPPTASADTASMTSAFVRSMKPKRALCAFSNARRMASGEASMTSIVVSDPA